MSFLVDCPTSERGSRLEHTDASEGWAAAVPALLRKHGFVPGEPAEERAFVIAARGAGCGFLEASGGLVEGPLEADVAQALGQSPQSETAPALYLYGQTGRSIGPIAYSSWRLRIRDSETGARSSLDYVSPLRRFAPRPVSFQRLRPAGDWAPVLYGAAAPSDRAADRFVVGLSDGRRLVLGIPLLDVLCSLMAWPDLPHGYFGLSSTLVPASVERWLVEALCEHASASGVGWVRIDPWPWARRWAVTVRHDYDRLLTDRQLRRRLDRYEELGVGSTWFLLKGRCIGHQARAIVGRGHEVGLHTTAETEQQFVEEIEHVGSETGLALQGVTAHGGDAIGFLGDRQYRWAQATGLRYSETIGRVSELAAPVVHARDGAVGMGDLILMATHRGVDAGMRPDQHNRDSLLQIQATLRDHGAHFVVMSHPDIHQSELDTVLEATRGSGAWDPTLADVACWCATVRHAARLARDGTTLALPRPSQFEFGVRVRGAGGEERAVKVVPGQVEVSLESPTEGGR